MNDLFVTATRKRYRFCYRGMITVEDLWSLDLESLDEIYKALNKEIKASEAPGLLSQEDAIDKDKLNKIEIVKYIFSVKKAEEDSRKKEAENALKRKRILEIIARKQDEALENMSEEELQKMLEETL